MLSIKTHAQSTAGRKKTSSFQKLNRLAFIGEDLQRSIHRFTLTMSDVELKWQYPKKRDLLGGDLLAQTLAHLGVEVSFGIHGGHLDAFLIGCDLVGIKLVDTRHESTAVQAAEGYAKVSGKVGCCFVTANSGYVFSIVTVGLVLML